MNLNTDTFWQYSLEVYGRRGVANKAIALQDEYQVNVNMLLLLCWCMDNGAIVTLNQWQVLQAAIADSETRLERHRTNRRAAKVAVPFDEKKYDNLKQQELGLELEQQDALTTMYNRLSVETVPVKGVNGSIAGFINLFGLRQQAEAVKLVSDVVKAL